MDEIKKTSTQDLMILRSSIIAYLRSKRLKKRNSNYMNVYVRMNYELNLRKKNLNFSSFSDAINETEDKKMENSIKGKDTTTEENLFIKKTNNSDLTEKKFYDSFEYCKKNSEINLLSRKLTQDSHLKIDIPSFLNDKKSLEIKKLKESLQDNNLILVNSINSPNNNFSGKISFIFKFYYLYTTYILLMYFYN